MTNTPAIIKEYLFHLLAQSLRILHYSEGCNSSKLPTLNPHLNPSTGLLVQLQAELRRLYEEETKGNTLNSGMTHWEICHNVEVSLTFFLMQRNIQFI